VNPRRLEGSQRTRGGLIFILLVLFILFIAARTVASWILDFQWWKEMNQIPTWINMMLYGVTPIIVAAIVTFASLWIAHARGMKAAGTGLHEHPLYARIATLVLALFSVVFAMAAVDSWTVVRYFGGRSLGADPNAWHDPVFGHPLAFYLFQLPFYSAMLRIVLTLSIVVVVLYWLTIRGWQFRTQLPHFNQNTIVDIADLKLLSGLESTFVKIIGVIFLVALAVWFYLGRYDMLLNDRGFMVGMDWVDQKVTLPLVWLSILAALAAAAFLWIGLKRFAIAMVVFPLLQFLVPKVVYSLYVRPNELAIERPYIEQHIEATRSAYALDHRAREVNFNAQMDAKIDVQKNAPLLDNVRLWDWRAFHDTLTQTQPLRPYTFYDTDVDRYIIDGQLRQVMVSPRELDFSQLGDAASLWTNPHLVYTHGYGIVMAEANKIAPNGLPVLFIKDAPPAITTKSLKLTRPQLYYGETVNEPVFVHTAQPEFDYPSGSDSVTFSYNGTGGFPISSFFLRLASAVYYGDWNILLTSQFTPDSRMMIHRKIEDRVSTLAGFVSWDPDPYIVDSTDGKLYWIIDGYLTSDAHPYSRSVNVDGIGDINYIRNSVKAVVDAYNGTVHLYIFDPSDPMIRAYENLFPKLFLPESAMPPDLRAHARYPETFFRVQAQMYRRYHMRNPEAFYNNNDLWDIARYLKGQESQPQPVDPTYVVATLPGEEKAEFLLIIPFTPRTKDNLIGMMVARCDGPHLGELVYLDLPKQQLLHGPMQVEALINQDQNISKDLTLWNQQGSNVLRGQMLVLPIDDTFIYIEPIYIQAREARMPQLKKVVLYIGNTLIYTDTWDEAVAQLAAYTPGGGAPASTASPAVSPPATAAATETPSNDPRIQQIREHLQRYRDLTSQGKWSDAGKELEAIQQIVSKAK
jgi:uncharacterized protein